MLIRELAYDTDEDQLDLLIDAFEPEEAEVVPLGDDIFLRRSIKTGKIIGATVANYSLWQSGRHNLPKLEGELSDSYLHIVRYLEIVKQKKAVVL
jgi:hypothetical protein